MQTVIFCRLLLDVDLTTLLNTVNKQTATKNKVCSALIQCSASRWKKFQVGQVWELM